MEYHTIETKLRRGQNLKLVGVSHEAEWVKLKKFNGELTLKEGHHLEYEDEKGYLLFYEGDFRKRERFYKEEIKRSDFIVIEQPVYRCFYEICNKSKRVLFEEIGREANKMKKEVYVIDPINEKVENSLENVCGSIRDRRIDKFRDMTIAKGLDEGISKINFDNAVLFQGNVHIKSINYYLNHPNWRNFNLNFFLVYKKMNSLGRKGIRKYSPIGIFSEDEYNLHPEKFWKEEII